MKFSAAIAQNRPLGPLPILVPKQAQHAHSWDLPDKGCASLRVGCLISDI